MSKILDGKRIRDEILAELHPRILALSGTRRAPALAVVLIGEDPASQIYVRNKIRTCQEIGVRSIEYRLPGHLTTDQVKERLRPLVDDPDVDGVLVQMPLPKHLNAEEIITYAVPPKRDVDGFDAVALGNLVLNRPWFRACTPAGILELLRRYQIPIAGRKAVVVGRSDIVGKPMALLLLHENATVSVCHSRTQDLAAECRTGDILVAAIGRPALIGETHIKEGAVVIDVGMNRITDEEQAKQLYGHNPSRLQSYSKSGSVLVGDVEPYAMQTRSSAYTPVPGGVGPLTIAMLMSNTVRAAELNLR